MKKLSKSDYKFNRNVKLKIESDSRENDGRIFFYNQPNPIYIPKRKYKK